MGNGQQKPGNALAVMAQRVMVSPEDLTRTLRETVFKGASDAEFVTLVAVANRYDLDPLARELYAFPKKGGGIVPMVPVDGWLKLIRTNPDFAGMDVRWADEMARPATQAKECPIWVEITIHHKSHPDHPTVHREWLDEMYRNTGPWNDTTKRMLEWKGYSQTGRIAFGLSGISDPDEAERIADGEVITGVATEVELLGEEGWAKMVESAAELGMSGDDLLANAAAFGYEGPGVEMPRDVAIKLFRAIREAAETEPPDDEPTSAPQEEPAEADEAAEEPVAAEEPSDATEATDEPQGSLIDGEEEHPSRGPKHSAEGKPRSAAEAALRAKANAEKRAASKPPTAAQQTLLAAKADELARIAGADATAYVLRSAADTDDVEAVTAANVVEVIEALNGAVKRARAARKDAVA
jgi:hypothetical protein